jgi:uncharacterized membrane-anchored protein
MTIRTFAAFAACVFLAAPAAAQQPPGLSPKQQQLLASIKWHEGPFDGPLGGVASVKVPAGYRFTDAAGSRAYMELLGNPPSSRMQGLMEPSGPNAQWLITFSYDDVGYVKDDEKDKIDANAILEGLKAGNVEANKQRAQMGVPPLDIVGWDQAPFYDAQNNRLSWAVRGQSEGQFIVNYNSRILGRGGVMSANLIVDPKDVTATLPKYKDLLTGFKFNPGQSHAEFKAGDKVAEYGLTALVAGGAVAVAAKTGILGKLIKPLIIGVVVVGGVFAKMFRAIFGGKSQD